MSPVVTQPTERPADYEDSFKTIKAQMMKISKLTKKYSEQEIDIKIKQALIEKAKDKVEYSLRGAVKRGKPKKMGMTEDEFSQEWRKKMRARLRKDGFHFVLSPPEQKILKEMQARERDEAVAEAAKIASEALKGIFSSIK